MKKILALLLALTMVFALAACGNSSQKEEEQKPEEPAVEQTAPAAEQTAPAVERVLLCSEAGFGGAEDETHYRYELYASAVPAFFAASGDQRSDEEIFEFYEEYDSESGAIQHETAITGLLADAYSEEGARSELQNRADVHAYRTYGEIETLKGNGYTAYYLRGVDSRDGEVVYYAIVCFDGEYFAAEIDFEASASLDPDMDEDDPDYGTDFDPAQYVKNAEEEFIAFLGSLSFERAEVEE